MSMANFFPLHHQVASKVLDACMAAGLPYPKAQAVATEVFETVREQIAEHVDDTVSERLVDLLQPSTN